mmetsp:Transcript_125332/g.350977  ORF Transcript_125332/g.350977 Transcript_125332/m.350977 type:complete len:858 (+) Transcript_125332:222-2795(+)
MTPQWSLEIEEGHGGGRGRRTQPLQGRARAVEAACSWSPEWKWDFSLEGQSPSGSTIDPEAKPWVEVAFDWVQWLPMQLATLLLFVTPQALFFGLPLVYQVFSASTLRECVDAHRRGTTEMYDFPCSWLLWHGKDEFAFASLLGMLAYLATSAFVAGCRGSDLILFVVYVVWCALFLISGMWKQEYVLIQDKRLAMQLVTLTIEFGILAVYWLRLCAIVLAMRTLSKHIVSKQKHRYVDTNNGFDLDLTYITPKIIAMGWPSSSVLEAQLRNSMSEVKRFLKIRHGGCYKVYNLCIERVNAKGSFEQEYSDIRFPDHNPCALADIDVICRDMEEFLQANPSNVVVVHCKAGKGRTGLVVSALLLRLRVAHTAQEALRRFAAKRTRDGKGVTIPSQIRYVQHYQRVLLEGHLRKRRWLRLMRLDISGMDDLKEGWRLQLITHDDGLIFCSETSTGTPPPMFDSDVKLAVFFEDRKVFQVWLHTAYDVRRVSLCDPSDDKLGQSIWVDPVVRARTEADFFLRLPRALLDGPHKGKGAAAKADWCIQALFQKPSDEEVEAFRVSRRRSRRPTHHQGRLAAGSEDYDALSDETDMEILLTSMCQGYLTRRRHVCARGSRRWCSLHISGALSIAGSLDTNLDVCLLNLVRDHTAASLQQVSPTQWRIRNNCSGNWETLEAPVDQAEQWLRAFADAKRLGEAQSDPLVEFSGLVWKAKAEASQQDFDLSDWSMRVVVLRKDGALSYYSWRESSDILLCRFSVGVGPICRSQFRWRSVTCLVPFEVHRADGPPVILAGAPQVVEGLFAAAERMVSPLPAPLPRSEVSRPRLRLAVSSVAALMGFSMEPARCHDGWSRTSTSTSV